MNKHTIQHALESIDHKIEYARSRILTWLLSTSADTVSRSCIGHSGGKDSVVTQWLVASTLAERSITLPVIHTSKPGGDNAIHPDTLNFLYQLPFSVELWPRALGSNPKYILQFDGSRASEYDRLDRSANFIKNGESVSRTELEFEVPNSMFGMTFIFPIYDWTDSDVWATIYRHALPYSPEYVAETEILKDLS
jgi:predicted phosphoadenosine phosphosulfate sulfurtransferase